MSTTFKSYDRDTVKSAARGREIDILCDVAGIPRERLDPAKVASAWRQRMAWKFHPDSGGSHEAMKAVNLGHDVLLALLQEEYAK